MQHRAPMLLLLVLVLLVAGGLWFGSKLLAPEPVHGETPGLDALIAEGQVADSDSGPLVAPTGPEEKPDDVREVALPAGEKSAARAQAAPSGSIWLAGLVVLPAGTPADEEVFVKARGKQFAGDRADPRTYTARVGASGTFRVAFAEGTSTGWISLKSRYVYLERSVRLKMDELPDELALAPRLGGRLVARVLAPPGLELEKGVLDEVNVSARSSDSNGVPRALVRIQDGLYEAGGVSPAADYKVEAASRKFADGERRDIEVAPGETTEVELSLEHGVALRGRVVNGLDAGLDEVDLRIVSKIGYVNASFEYMRVTTDDEGHFEAFGVPAGALELRVEREGYVETREDLGEAENGEVRDGIRVVIEQGNWVEGFVQWPDGRSGKTITVKVSREREGGFYPLTESRSQTVDAEGHFRVTGLGVGPFEVSASARGKKRAERWHAVQEGVPANTANLVLVLVAGSSFSGRVVDDLGEPVAKFRVTAKPANESPFQRTGGDRISDTFFAKDGAFELANLFDAEWLVVVHAEGFGRSDAVRVTIPSGASEPTFVVPRFASLSGVVRDNDGAPVPGARVAYTYPHRNRDIMVYDPESRGHRTSDSEGGFAFDALAPGVLELEASKAGSGGSLKQRVELLPAVPAEGIVLVMRQPARLTGEVDPSNGRVAGRVIQLQGPDSRHLESDGSGRFTADDLPPGEYNVTLQVDPEEVRSDDRQLIRALAKSVEVELFEGRTTHVVIGAPPERPIRVHGRVTEAGAGVADLLVTCNPADSAWTRKVAARTDSKGRYELTLDGAGSYHFSVGKDLGSSIGYGREVPDRKAVELDFALPACRVAGTLYGPTGAPLAGKRVELSCDSPDEGAEGWSPRTTGSTSEAGAFTFENLAPGKYTLRAGGLMPWEVAPVSKTYGRVVVPDLVLEKGGALTGLDVRLSHAGSIDVTVFGSDGAPAAGANVTVTDVEGRDLWGYYPAFTSDTGKIRMRGIAAGTVKLFARSGESVGPARAVKVFEGQSAAVELVVD